MNMDFKKYFVICIFMTSMKYTLADLHIDHKEDNLISDISNKNGTLAVSISENVDPDFTRYENEAEVQIYLQKPANETKDDTIVYSVSKTKNDGTANWFSYATSKGTTREETMLFKKEPNEEAEKLTVKGTYSHVGDDGVRYIVGYTAGEKGYLAKVLFGTKVKIEEFPTIDTSDRLLDTGIDEIKGRKGVGGGDLMCSLVGGGCF